MVEADESDGSFLQYPAEVAVVTNVDPDHLSNWGTAENYADGFLAFATGEQVRLVVISADDPGAVALTERSACGSTADVEVITFGSGARRTCGSPTRLWPVPARASGCSGMVERRPGRAHVSRGTTTCSTRRRRTR